MDPRCLPGMIDIWGTRSDRGLWTVITGSGIVAPGRAPAAFKARLGGSVMVTSTASVVGVAVAGDLTRIPADSAYVGGRMAGQRSGQRHFYNRCLGVEFRGFGRCNFRDSGGRHQCGPQRGGAAQA